MNMSVTIDINAPKETIWAKITDIEKSVETISGIEEIEVLEKPEDSLVGLKWRETRTLFGKQATEVMWITDAEENHYYKTRAESHGAIYTTILKLEEKEGVTELSMTFGGKAQTFMAKIMSAIMMPFFKKATKKALEKDLEDIKRASEN